MQCLIEEMINALKSAPHKYHDKDVKNIMNGMNLGTLKTNPEDALREHALYCYTCEGPSYYIKECLRKCEYSSIQSFLSCVFCPEAIDKVKFKDNLALPVYSGINENET
mmetsp:Transcript_2643/g.4106  ORF Transcript_2643/g.4106 Transcript_2643/m.4106 type:complete len:109 (+) Transcript_2643:2470-2796(+)